ncbi:MAG: DUF4235 domain-containing protein [Acidimicrobiia bacterium]
MSNTFTEERIWRMTSWAAAVVAAWAVRQSVAAIWPRAVGRDAPKSPADPDATWREVALWALITGLAAALARALGRKGAAVVWTRVTGDDPPVV